MRITEKQLINIIKESTNEIMSSLLKEAKYKDFYNMSGIIDKTTSQEKKWEKVNFMIKMISQKRGIDPNSLKYDEIANVIYIDDKPKKMKIQIKPGETVDDFQKRIVNVNKKFAEELNKYPDEEWRSVTNSRGRYTRVKENPDNILEVSNLGRVKIIDTTNALSSRIIDPHYAPTKIATQVHIKNITCPPVKGMVVDAFPEFVEWEDGAEYLKPNQTVIVNKDGDPTNCAASNLLVRKRSGYNDGGIKLSKMKEVAESKHSIKISESQLKQIIKESIKNSLR